MKVLTMVVIKKKKKKALNLGKHILKNKKNLANTFSKIMKANIFFFFLMIGPRYRLQANFFFFWFGPRFRPKLWHGWRGLQVPDGPSLELRKKSV